MLGKSFIIVVCRSRFLLAFSLAWLCIIGTFIGGSSWNKVHAQISSGSTQVIIAVDVTASSHCSLTKKSWSSVTHKPLGITYTSCLAGTNIQTEVVPLLQAQAQHEAYVTLLPRNSPSSIRQQWYKQVNDLIAVKRSNLQHLVRPNSRTCPDGNEDQWIGLSFYFNPSHLPVDSGTWYHVLSSCATIVFQHMQVSGTGSGTGPAYWPDLHYVGVHWGCPMGLNHPDYLDDHTLNFYPVSGQPNSLTQPYGYYLVYYIGNVDQCHINPGGGNIFETSSVLIN